MKRYSEATKKHILARYHAGESPRELEREFNLSEGLVCKWDWHRKNNRGAINQTNALVEENRALRAEVSLLRRIIHMLTGE